MLAQKSRVATYPLSGDLQLATALYLAMLLESLVAIIMVLGCWEVHPIVLDCHVSLGSDQ